ncbi:MAG: L-aspartate oxidase [Lachnospiraceae bacterium]
METDIVIVGCGCAGLYCALHLPQDKRIIMLAKGSLEESDSFLAQGGICMLKNEADYPKYFEDTMRAGHYENRKESVDIMLRSSQDVIRDLLDYDVDFQRDENGELAFTREGAHSDKRILFYKDTTGAEITRKLIQQVRNRSNITIYEHHIMIDLLCDDNQCYGVLVKKEDGSVEPIHARETILACGGIGGLYEHSTNYKLLTGDAVALALKYQIKTENVHYVQIHPTTLYEPDNKKRSFLISESVRGEGAVLYNQKMERFANELLPRDVLTSAIRNQMKMEQSKFVWLDMSPIPEQKLKEHFPNIIQYCKEAGYDVFHECIPVVPAQHYFMGGIYVDRDSHTSKHRLYAIGETACNGVHGRNRLASNSLLESLVFAKRAAHRIASEIDELPEVLSEDIRSVLQTVESEYQGMIETEEQCKKRESEFRDFVWNEIKRLERKHESK